LAKVEHAIAWYDMWHRISQMEGLESLRITLCDMLPPGIEWYLMKPLWDIKKPNDFVISITSLFDASSDYTAAPFRIESMA
jgi:hypothetical protein